MKKLFEIPEMEVVRFVEADIVVCSGTDWTCGSYTDDDGKTCNVVSGSDPFPGGECWDYCDPDTSRGTTECDGDMGTGCESDGYCYTDSCSSDS